MCVRLTLIVLYDKAFKECKIVNQNEKDDKNNQSLTKCLKVFLARICILDLNYIFICKSFNLILYVQINKAFIKRKNILSFR